MEFFQKLAATGDVDISLRIMGKNGKLTMHLMPGSNQSTCKPWNITGTPEELDRDFFDKIAPGVKELAGLVSNLDDVKEDIAKKKEGKEKKAASWKTPAKKAKAKAEKKTAKKATPAAKSKPAIPKPVEGSLFDDGQNKEAEVAEDAEAETTEEIEETGDQEAGDTAE